MILLLKLSDGTEVIGDIEEVEGQGVYSALNLLQIVTKQENGQMSIGLVPFMPYIAKETQTLIPTNMAIICQPSDNIVEHYNQMFSAIIVPKSKIVTQ